LKQAQVHEQRGEYVEMRDHCREAIKLLGPADPIRLRVEQAGRVAEAMARLEGRMPALLRGEEKLSGRMELESLAHLCLLRGRHGAAARLYDELLAARPDASRLLPAAARAAFLAGAGKGEGGPALTEATRSLCRRQALTWLQAIIRRHARLMSEGPPRARRQAKEKLRSSLRGLPRGGAGLAEGEREAARRRGGCGPTSC